MNAPLPRFLLKASEICDPGPVPKGFVAAAAMAALRGAEWREALGNAFLWHESSQGYRFWNDELSRQTLSDAARLILQNWLGRLDGEF